MFYFWIWCSASGTIMHCMVFSMIFITSINYYLSSDVAGYSAETLCPLCEPNITQWEQIFTFWQVRQTISFICPWCYSHTSSVCSWWPSEINWAFCSLFCFTISTMLMFFGNYSSILLRIWTSPLHVCIGQVNMIRPFQAVARFLIQC